MHFEQVKIDFTLGDLVDYVRGRTILARLLHDRSVIPRLGRLVGRVVEIGSGAHDYSRHAVQCAEYVRSDAFAGKSDGSLALDATDIALPDASVDAIVCVNTLEHIRDYAGAVREFFRVVRPGGRVLLCTPWLFPFHGAPGDYYRFSPSALLKDFSMFEALSMESVGNFWLSQAVFLQRPKWSRPPGDKSPRWYDPLLRMIGCVFMLMGARASGREDDRYSLLYTCLFRKPG